MAACIIDAITKFIFPINHPLIKLKLCFFLVYSGKYCGYIVFLNILEMLILYSMFIAWFSVFPYVALISAQIITFQQLAILHACVPLSSICGPILTGKWLFIQVRTLVNIY